MKHCSQTHLHILEEKIAFFHLASSLAVSLTVSSPISSPFLASSFSPVTNVNFLSFLFFFYPVKPIIWSVLSLSPDLSFLQLTFLSHHWYPFISSSQKTPLPVFFPIAMNHGAALATRAAGCDRNKGGEYRVSPNPSCTGLGKESCYNIPWVTFIFW